MLDRSPPPKLDPNKFKNPDTTAKGDTRARVGLKALETLWINTGTLCNITCENCYIFSSPTNDALVYFTLADTLSLLDEIKELELGTREIGFTGGEPFMNPQMLDMARACLTAGHEVLILTNAMAPLQRPACKTGLLELQAEFGDKLTLRISIDHHSEQMHDTERGAGSFAKTLEGTDWLAQNGFSLAVAGRSIWNENELAARQGYEALFKSRGWPIDAYNAAQTVLFPEMDENVDVPEITTACWGILNLDPMAMMCATSRMVIKRKGEDAIKIMPCTLLPYDAAFEMGTSLKQSLKANEGNFAKGAVKLNHPHCAKFCVLGGGSCSA